MKKAVMMVEPHLLEQLLHSKFDEKALASKRPLGAASGRIYFDVESLLAAKARGEEKTILVRIETSPKDIVGMNACNGILTPRGAIGAGMLAEAGSEFFSFGTNGFNSDDIWL